MLGGSIMKRFKSIVLILLITISTVFLLSACSNDSKVASDQKIILKFAGVNNSTHATIRAINEKFKPMVEELTDNKVEVQVFDNAQLGGERDLMEQLQVGSLQMAYISPVLASVEPAINVLDLPFLFKDESHVDLVVDGQIGKDLLKDLPSKGLVPLGYFENGFRVVTNSKKEINNINDIKGLKIRTPEAPISVSIFQSVGANVVTLSFGELYSALQQGVVDGQENAYNTVASSRLFEVQKYVAETNHMWGSFVILASNKWWASLDPTIQDAITKASAEASKYQRQIFRSETAGSKQKCLDNGMIATTPDMAAFEEATKPVYDNFVKQYPQYKDIIERIKDKKSEL